MVRDERVMLPRWLAHYGGQLGPENLFVIDDNSSDGSTDALACSVIRIPDWGSKHFEATRMKVVSSFAAGLLEAYDAVLFADADEFLVADPAKFSGLRDLVSSRPKRAVLGAVGVNVIHDVGREAALDPSLPILAQRRFAKFVPLMCKPSIKRVSDPWMAGSHGITVPYEVDPHLWLFHMKFAEESHLRRTGDQRNALVESQGRAAETAWQFDGGELVALLHRITRDLDPARVPELVPRPRKLASIVRQADNGVYRAHGRRQIAAMESQDVARIPDRFLGLV